MAAATQVHYFLGLSGMLEKNGPMICMSVPKITGPRQNEITVRAARAPNTSTTNQIIYR